MTSKYPQDGGSIIEEFHVTSYQANFASHHTHDRQNVQSTLYVVHMSLYDPFCRMFCILSLSLINSYCLLMCGVNSAHLMLNFIFNHIQCVLLIKLLGLKTDL